MSLLLLALQFGAGFVLLVGGAEALVRSASRIATRYGLPPVLIGLTIVALGTSLPELVVSLTAALIDDGGDIAIGNIVGSNIANFGLILGLAGLIAPLPVAAEFTRRELPILLFVSLIFAGLAWLDRDINRIEGALLVLGFGVTMVRSWRAATSEPLYSKELRETMDTVEAIDPSAVKPSRSLLIDILGIVLGLGTLVLGAQWLVAAATEIARAFGV
jgi:cation:H+ antiporter